MNDFNLYVDKFSLPFSFSVCFHTLKPSKLHLCFHFSFKLFASLKYYYYYYSEEHIITFITD